MIQQTRRVAFAVVLIAVGLMASGCSHLEVRDRWFDSDRVAEVPSEILPIWTDTVLHQPGKPGVRGFGGRVYFYEEGKPNPVKVDGQLVVYAFDGSETGLKANAPLRKFVITADELISHHSDSSLGNSYSVWLPWDKVGGESRTLSLVVRFNGRNGGTAMSKPARMLLPGVERPSIENERSGGVQLASHEVDGEVRTASPYVQPTMQTDSIDLPPHFQRRLRSPVLTPSAEMPQPGNESLPETSTITANTNGPATNTFGGSSLGTAASASRGTSGWEPLGLAEQALLHHAAGPMQAGPQQAEGMDGPALDQASSADFAPRRFPARMRPATQPGRAPVRRQPHPGGWPSDLPPTPRTDWNSKRNQGSPVPVTADFQAKYPSR